LKAKRVAVRANVFGLLDLVLVLLENVWPQELLALSISIIAQRKIKVAALKKKEVPLVVPDINVHMPLTLHQVPRENVLTLNINSMRY
jgi:hypothetical protein